MVTPPAVEAQSPLVRPNATDDDFGDAPDFDSSSCVDGSASGGPYDDAETLYTKEITICENVTYTIEISCCWNQKGYFYL